MFTHKLLLDYNFPFNFCVLSLFAVLWGIEPEASCMPGKRATAELQFPSLMLEPAGSLGLAATNTESKLLSLGSQRHGPGQSRNLPPSELPSLPPYRQGITVCSEQQATNKAVRPA